ncbi:MAG: hypothetical protein WCJ35_02575 [Planctomycetota bacterium]
MKRITLIALLTAVVFAPRAALHAADAPQPATAPAREGKLTSTKDGALVWESAAGRVVRINAPQLSLTHPNDQAKLSLNVKLKDRVVRGGEAVLAYALGLKERGLAISGTLAVKISLPARAGEDVLISRMAVTFDQPVMANLETVYGFDVEGEPARQMGLPERDGYFKIRPMTPEVGGAGKFELGQAAKGPIQCSTLGMPVVGLIFGEAVPQLAVAADPYCGSFIQAQPRTAGTHITVRTTYSGAVVPVRREERTVALEFHRNGADGTCRAFYRTIPEIEPGAPWTQGIHLVYYDYLSQKGEGWFKDLKVLADRIPPQHRGRVALCLHGWYDYFQQYAFDHKTGKLLNEWTAFPGTHKVPMRLAEMHRRLKFAKDLGFRVLLYFSDGTNSDSGAPAFCKEYVLKGKNGKTFPGWKGPDSLGQPLMMDPSVPGLRDWYRGYLKALLDEYCKEVDGFVWDETFYIKTNFISYPANQPSYTDRAMMSLVSELTQMMQNYRKDNPDLVFLASDIGQTSYALVANGTWQDSAMEERAWGPSMFANYRNCLWSCNWSPLRHAKENQIAAEKYGLPQGLSNGWEDNCGPSRMPPELLDTVLKRFTKNVESNRQRLRYLLP